MSIQLLLATCVMDVTARSRAQSCRADQIASVHNYNQCYTEIKMQLYSLIGTVSDFCHKERHYAFFMAF